MTNDDRSHRSSSGCHVAESDVAPGLGSFVWLGVVVKWLGGGVALAWCWCCMVVV